MMLTVVLRHASVEVLGIMAANNRIGDFRPPVTSSAHGLQSYKKRITYDGGLRDLPRRDESYATAFPML